MSESTAPLDELMKKAIVSDQPDSAEDKDVQVKPPQTGSSDPFSDQPSSLADPTVALDYDPKVAMEQAKEASDFKIMPVNAQVAVAGDDEEKQAAAKKLADTMNADLADSPAFTTKWTDGEPQNKPGLKLNQAPTNVLIL